MTRTGATLPELIVALLVIAVVLTAGYGAFAQVSDGRELAHRHLQPAVRTASIRALLTRWISSARVSEGDEGWAFVGLGGEGAGHDELHFVAGTAAPWVDGAAQIRLFVDSDPATPERGLVAEVVPVQGDPGPFRFQLSPWVTDLQARYLPRSGDGELWNDSWLSSLQLPAAVEVTLAAAPPDSLGRLIRVPMLIPLARQDSL